MIPPIVFILLEAHLFAISVTCFTYNVIRNYDDLIYISSGIWFNWHLNVVHNLQLAKYVTTQFILHAYFRKCYINNQAVTCQFGIHTSKLEYEYIQYCQTCHLSFWYALIEIRI